MNALGTEFAVFRGQESGEVFITDVYCPHLGANVTTGGKVVGDCVQCPFHEWKFDGQTGKCVEIPYAKKVTRPFSRFDGTFLRSNATIVPGPRREHQR